MHLSRTRGGIHAHRLKLGIIDTLIYLAVALLIFVIYPSNIYVLTPVQVVLHMAKTGFSATRFGNVLGSNGSKPETARCQLAIHYR